MTVLLWGNVSDPPLAAVAEQLAVRGADTVMVGSDLAGIDYDVAVAPSPTGWLDVDGRRLPVDAIAGVYLRPDEPPVDRVRAGAELTVLVAALPATVINRPAAGRSNWSKPFQLRLLRAAGLDVPETLVTTNPSDAAEFAARHQRVVYKSVSGVRSIVSLYDPADRDRLELVRAVPVQFQRWIPGTDVRVHVVGQRWFATAVASAVTDYRYPTDPDDVTMVAAEIPDELGRRLVGVTRQLGLLVSGADLRRTPDGRWFALEVNPSPGFTFYEAATGQPIAAAIADLLTTPR